MEDQPNNEDTETTSNDEQAATPHVEPTPQEPVEQPESQVAPVVAPTKSPWYKNRKIVLAIVLLVFLAGAGIGYVALHKEAKPTPAPVVTKKAVVKLPKQVATHATFLSQPIQLSDLQLFTDKFKVFGGECNYDEKAQTCVPAGDIPVKYYQIGSTGSNQSIIIAQGPDQGLEGSVSILFIKTSEAKYTAYLKQFSNYEYATEAINNQTINEYAQHLAGNVTANKTDLLSDLLFDKQVTIKGIKLSGSRDYQSDKIYTPIGDLIQGVNQIRGTYAPTINPVKLGSVNGRDFYQVTTSENALFTVKAFYAARGGSLGTGYSIDDPITITKKPSITWKSGEETANSHPFTTSPAGCGSANGYIVAKDIDKSSLIAAGTDAEGNTLYQLPLDNALLTKIYNEDYGTGEYTQDSKYKNLTKEQYQADHGVFVKTNALGEYVVYQNTDVNAVGGGCAKPVIYLYPSTPTHVNVKVGAAVTKSEPLYPSGGWQNVLAQPNGKLTYQGKQYDSLFWEGIGIGDYPAITSGTVVRSADAVSTIRRQLAAQGFNATETQDFLDYWQPKLPHAPYVRLTWFTTDQLNLLAPLTITPKPQTIIRTFLDFQGLNTPVSLPTQHFSAPARNGFTAVEWGGYLRN